MFIMYQLQFQPFLSDQEVSLLDQSIGRHPFSIKNLYFEIKQYLLHHKKRYQMSELLVRFCDIPQYKLFIRFKRFIWFRAPIKQCSQISINLFDINIHLQASNNQFKEPSSVQYHIPSNQFLQSFYRQSIRLQIIENTQNVGFCQIQPTTLIQKPIIVPIISNTRFEGRDIKLGDIQIQFSIQKSKADVQQLYQVKEYLQTIESNPYEFKKLVNRLKKQRLI